MSGSRSELPSNSAPRVLRHAVYEAAMLLAPVLLLPGTFLNPAVGGIVPGPRTSMRTRRPIPSATNCTSLSISLKRAAWRSARASTEVGGARPRAS
jgi:hypothetical protein